MDVMKNNSVDCAGEAFRFFSIIVFFSCYISSFQGFDS